MSASFTFEVATRGTTTARVYRASDPIAATLILAHGAGAAQTHPFMIDMATRIAQRGIDVVTFNFLYTEQGRKMPDRTDVLEAAWHAAIASVRARGGLPTERLFCGGKSMGGRIASNVAASAAGEGLTLSGLVFLGYPLHPADKPKARRDEHLARVPFPMLFVQGSRDALGNAAEIRAVVRRLPQASLHVVEGGDHSLALLKRDAKNTQEAALEGAADAIAAFVRAPRGSRGPRKR
ncbi:MAG TPA: alpha/beta family hydrolase [Labilithrix sp.]|nr:alpha/beta family hydrolase [Labilithrix sp.]